VQAAASGCVVASDDDLFLLDGERESFQAWIFGFEDGCVEAIIVLWWRGVS
jgi:hypothetical protein